MSIMRKCLYCFREFKTFSCRIKTGSGKHCSKKCFYSDNKNENNCNWKGDNVSIGALHWWIREHYGRPKKCEDCGTTDPNKRYEWANISGEYKRDIKDFKRLCLDCHRKFDSHLILRGEKHPKSKLTNKDILKIRKYYIPYKYSAFKLAKEFNVKRSAIIRVVNRKTWKHI